MSRKSLALLLVLILASFAGASAQSLVANPTATVYDPVRDCYYVTNQNTGLTAGIVMIDSLHVHSYFNSGQFTSCTGLHLRNDTLYMTTRTKLILFDVNTRAVLTQISIPGSARLYDLRADSHDNLYLSDYTANKIFKVRIGTWEVSTFVSSIPVACGLWVQESHNRLLVAYNAPESIIGAVDLTDSSLSIVVPAGIGDLDRFTEDDEENIYVSDWTNDVIFKFDPDLTSHVTVVAGLRDPSGICMDVRRKIMFIPEQTISRTRFLEMEIGHFNRVWDRAPVNEGASSDASGAAWVDYDNDGYDDLYVTNAGTLPGLDNRLYHNDSGSAFTRLTGLYITGDVGVSQSSTWADYDNDGAIDCFVANAEGQTDVLYRNAGGGIFTQESAGSLTSEAGNTTAAAWGDVDGDGLVDLFRAGRDGCGLYRNTGTGFADVTPGDLSSGSASGASWSDYDGDLDQDLFVPFVDGGSGDPDDRLYRNAGGTLAAVTAPPIGTDGVSTYGGSWGDVDNDGDPDLFVPASTEDSDGNDFLYLNDGDGTFTLDPTSPAATSGGNSLSSCWADLNNDGYLDLFVANSYTGSGPVGNFLFWNNGDGTLRRETVGQIVNDTAYCTSVAAADYDHDGDLDLYVTQSGGRVSMLYRNNTSPGAWLELQCVGTQTNASALGTIVRVKATINDVPVWQTRTISAQTGAGAQNSLTVHFGVPTITIDTILVLWPSGTVNVLENVEPGQSLIVYEQCCGGRVGDVNGVGGDEPTISDISTLIDAKFLTGSCDGVLDCLAEADMNQSGGKSPSCNDITIGDISALIDYLFISGSTVGLAKCL